jgi:hypothetical protein
MAGPLWVALLFCDFVRVLWICVESSLSLVQQPPFPFFCTTTTTPKRLAFRPCSTITGHKIEALEGEPVAEFSDVSAGRRWWLKFRWEKLQIQFVSIARIISQRIKLTLSQILQGLIRNEMWEIKIWIEAIIYRNNRSINQVIKGYLGIFNSHNQ